MYVTPCAGVWIEIVIATLIVCVPLSLPVRECGLKFKTVSADIKSKPVTPCAGVWIEINVFGGAFRKSSVTPCAGMWIEISASLALTVSIIGHSLCGSVD